MTVDEKKELHELLFAETNVADEEGFVLVAQKQLNGDKTARRVARVQELLEKL